MTRPTLCPQFVEQFGFLSVQETGLVFRDECERKLKQWTVEENKVKSLATLPKENLLLELFENTIYMITASHGIEEYEPASATFSRSVKLMGLEELGYKPYCKITKTRLYMSFDNGCFVGWNKHSGDLVAHFQNIATKVQHLVEHKDLLIVSCEDNTAYSFNLDGGPPLRRFTGHTQVIEKLKVVKDKLLASSKAGKLIIWDLKSATNLSEAWLVSRCFETLGSFLFTPDAASPEKIAMRDLEKSNVQWLTGHKAPITQLVKADGMLYSGAQDGTVISWLITPLGTFPNKVFLAHRGPISQILPQSDGALITYSDYDQMAHVWDTATGERLQACNRAWDRTQKILYSSRRLIFISDINSIEAVRLAGRRIVPTSSSPRASYYLENLKRSNSDS